MFVTIMIAIVFAAGILCFVFSTDFTTATKSDVMVHLGFSALVMAVIAIVMLLVLAIVTTASVPKEEAYEESEQVVLESADFSSKSIKLVSEDGRDWSVSLKNIEIKSDTSLDEGELMLTISTAKNDFLMRAFHTYSLSLGPGARIGDDVDEDFE